MGFIMAQSFWPECPVLGMLSTMQGTCAANYLGKSKLVQNTIQTQVEQVSTPPYLPTPHTHPAPSRRQTKAKNCLQWEGSALFMASSVRKVQEQALRQHSLGSHCNIIWNVNKNTAVRFQLKAKLWLCLYVIYHVGVSHFKCIKPNKRIWINKTLSITSFPQQTHLLLFLFCHFRLWAVWIRNHLFSGLYSI